MPSAPVVPRPGDSKVLYPTVINTADPAEARIQTQQFLGNPHVMRVLERDKPFYARVRYRSVHGLGLMSSQYGAAVEISCSPPIQKVSVNFIAGGKMLIQDGAALGNGTVADEEHGAVFSFEGDVTMRWAPGVRQLMLTVDKHLVERHLHSLLSEPLHGPLIFDTAVDLANGGQAIAAAVQTLKKAFELSGRADPPPVLAKEIEHGVLTAILLGLRHSYTEQIFSVQPLPSPRTIRRVLEFIHSSTDTAFSVADLAEVAGVSERSLHAAFRRQLGTSPMSYVRRHRLERVREELLSLDPAAGVTVTDVALRHGFAHTGRFAAAYRERFGEPPSATMRR